MKKLIITAIAVAAGFLANAENIRIVEKDKTGKIVTNIYDAVEYSKKLAKDNTDMSWKQLNAIAFGRLSDVNTIGECDDILSQAKFYSFSYSPSIMLKYPKCTKNTDNMLIEYIPSAKLLAEDKTSEARIVKGMVMHLFKEKFISQQEIIVKKFLSAATIRVKEQLRKEGKSFIGEDGKNPVQERINLLTAALNSKRLAGFNNAMTLCGFDYGIDYEAMLLPEETIKKLCDDIFYGRVEFSKYNRARLRTHLGVEEYNAFVKKYNND